MAGRPRLARPIGYLALGLAVAAGAGLALDRSDRSGPPAAGAPVPLPVTTVALERQAAYRIERPFLGRVEAARRTELGFERGGRVVAIAVDEGDPVAPGQVLAVLDRARLEAERAELDAAVAAAESRQGLAERTRARLTPMAAADHASRQRLDEAVEGARTAGAELRLARARLARNRVELDKSMLTAPYAGRVVRRLVDEGSVVEAGRPVLVLIDDAAREARVGVAGPLLEHVREGETYPLEVNGATVRGRVRSVLPSRDRGRRTVDVILVFDPPAGVIRDGDPVRIQLEAEIRRPGYWVPASALTEAERGLWSLLVTRPLEGAPASGGSASLARLERRLVQVIAVEPERVFVTGLLQGAERVVAGGVHRVVPGQVVRVARRGSGPGREEA